MSQATDQMVEKVFQAVLGGMEAISIAIGDRLGYYAALDERGAMTSAELAAAAGASERYTREWLEQQAVCGYLSVTDGTPRERRFALEPGAAEALARPDELTTVAPLGRMIAAAAAQWTRIAEGAGSGDGLGWAEYGVDMLESQADVNAPPLRTLLADEWLGAALPDVHRRLESGEPLRIADIGCGAGWASVALARRFPAVSIDAFDKDPATIVLARANVDAAGLGERVRVHETDLTSGDPPGGYDLVLAVECLHDMSHPVPVLAAMRAMSRPGGEVLVIDEKVAEEFTAPGDDVERLMYGYSTLICLPDAMSGHPDEATGTVMRTATVRRYATEAGFDDVEVRPVDHDLWRFYRLS